jgi:hypothetical protein
MTAQRLMRRSQRGTVMIPNAVCRTSVTIIVPNSANLVGTTFAPTQPTSGSQIVCDLAVSPCVEIYSPASGSSTQGGQSVKDLTITREAGAIPSGSIGLLVSNSVSTSIQNVDIDGHDIAISYYSLPGGIWGIVADATNIYTCNIATTHILFTSWAELKLDKGRFGCNDSRLSGSPAQYMKFVGGSDGPNTIHITNSQFNDDPVPGTYPNNQVQCLFQ